MAPPDGAPAIRDARPGEAQAILDVTLAAYAEYASGLGPVWEPYRDNIVTTLADVRPAQQIVAERRGALVGAVLLYPPGAMAPLETVAPEVRLLAVAPAARGQGVGAALMQECVRRARASGAAVLGLHTMDVMEAALRLYARLGFVRAPDVDFQPAPSLTVKGFRLDLGA
jgi:ribosomal protein S18 acetylase RimI-like enzyme